MTSRNCLDADFQLVCQDALAHKPQAAFKKPSLNGSLLLYSLRVYYRKRLLKTVLLDEGCAKTVCGNLGHTGHNIIAYRISFS